MSDETLLSLLITHLINFTKKFEGYVDGANYALVRAQ